MFSNPLVARWDVIAAAQHAVRYGGASLRNVPGLLKRLIREEMWQEYVLPTGEVTTFATFQEFLTSQWGLDTTLETIQRICGEDLETLDALDQVTTRKPGASKDNQHAVRISDAEKEQTSLNLLEPRTETITDNISNCLNRQESHGTSRTYALRRLRHSRPDIHTRVLAGELSPHRGMIEAGFRHEPTPLDYLHRYWRQVEPEDRLRFLTEMLTPNERRALRMGFEESTP